MADTSGCAPERPEYYTIRIEGCLDPRWSEWFDDLAVVVDASRGETALSGPVVDQAALHGLLAKLRDLNLSLLSVARINRPRPE